MVTTRGVVDLEWMLDHELCLAERYRRFVSVAMLKPSVDISPKKLLENTLRNSDVYFEFGNSIGAVLMSETNTSGAVSAIERYRDNCSGLGMTFAIGSYPQDHHSARGLLSIIYKRLKKAEEEGDGAVIISDPSQ
ncbi:MAG TPA: hypothetical protein PKH31_03265 [Candidatus Sumerlaeota bacterium]|nr:hypothetical protein [Candidatus Sumerlaeota bacterium]